MQATAETAGKAGRTLATVRVMVTVIATKTAPTTVITEASETCVRLQHQKSST
jgi:hypothetical protein